MPREQNLPPPIRGTDRGEPKLAESSPRAADLLFRLAGQGQADPTQQAVSLVMQAAQMLIQAGEIDPMVAPVIQQTLATLQSGLRNIGTGGGVAPPTRRRRPPEQPGGEEALNL